MRLHAVYDDLLDTGTKIRLLRVFFRHPGKEFSEREMERIAQIPQASVHRNLGPLLANGIVSLRRVGKTNLHSLNVNHVLYKPLAYLFKTEGELLRTLGETITAELRRKRAVLAVVLYGSILKRAERPDSDVDIFLLTDDTRVTSFEPTLDKIRVQIAQRFGNPVSFYVKARHELAELRHAAVYREIKAGEILFSRGAIEW